MRPFSVLIVSAWVGALLWKHEWGMLGAFILGLAWMGVLVRWGQPR